MEPWLKALFHQQGITEVGVCQADGGSVLVALFPYYTGEQNGANLSRYAWAPDYHRTVKKLLTPVAQEIQNRYPGAEAEVLVDNHPLPERKLAYEAGLGFMGKNGCLIHPVYGSYVFIGLIRTSLDLKADAPMNRTCIGCNACVAACPTGALKSGFDRLYCLSDLTQKRGTFTPEEEARFLKGKLVWGCDRCQEVCPHNRDLPITPLAPFSEGLKPQLTSADLDGLSDRAFRRVYGAYAFSWRGVQPLRRNLLLKEEKA